MAAVVRKPKQAVDSVFDKPVPTKAKQEVAVTFPSVRILQ